MTLNRLNDDQRVLYEALKVIWVKQSTRIIIAIFFAITLAVGIVIGVVQGTRASLRQTAVVIASLQDQININRELLMAQGRQREMEQAQYQNILAAFERVKRHGASDQGRAQTDHNRAVKDRR